MTVFVVQSADGSQAAGSFTLEQVLSSPFPSELVTARQGNRVAWVFNVKGLRNVLVAAS